MNVKNRTITLRYNKQVCKTLTRKYYRTRIQEQIPKVLPKYYKQD